MSNNLLCPWCFRLNRNPVTARILQKRRRNRIETEARVECEHCGKAFQFRSLVTGEIVKLYSALPANGRIRIIGIA